MFFKERKKELLTGTATIATTALIGHHVLESFGVPHGMAESLVVAVEVGTLPMLVAAGGVRDKITHLFKKN